MTSLLGMFPECQREEWERPLGTLWGKQGRPYTSPQPGVLKETPRPTLEEPRGCSTVLFQPLALIPTGQGQSLLAAPHRKGSCAPVAGRGDLCLCLRQASPWSQALWAMRRRCGNAGPCKFPPCQSSSPPRQVAAGAALVAAPPSGSCGAPLSGTMQALVSPVTKAVFVALFLFAILLTLYVIPWYICRDVDNDYI